jgi:succinate dehydrogenase / fumarate reductase flavoprotein subunit
VEQETTDRLRKLLSIKGRKTVTEFHKQLGKILWDHCGMARHEKGLKQALELIPQLREEFWQNVLVPGSGQELNQSLERAGRVADFLELGEVLVRDALTRDESCGCHLREEHQTPEGECDRNDADYAHVAAWGYEGDGKTPTRHVEPLKYEEVQLATRSYK